MMEIFPPDYVCYKANLCESEVLLSLTQYTTIDLFNNNSTCISTTQMPNHNRPDAWHHIVRQVYSLFHQCAIPRQPLWIKNLSNVYSCKNSSKMISQHRLKDMVKDCLYDDDESYEDSCSINNIQHRFRCTDYHKNTVCLSHLLVGDTVNNCLDQSDETNLNGEQNSETAISFQTMCDGFTELSPILINGTNETDETECSNFHCNNTYTRCDGTWNCLDGADEVNCEWPLLCPSFHHMCLSKSTGNLTCLSIEHANNDVVDCLGSSDERKFCRANGDHPARVYRCADADRCISSLSVCSAFLSCNFSNGPPHFCTAITSIAVVCEQLKSLNYVEQVLCLLNDARKQSILHLSLTVNSSSKWIFKSSKLIIFPIRRIPLESRSFLEKQLRKKQLMRACHSILKNEMSRIKPLFEIE